MATGTVIERICTEGLTAAYRRGRSVSGAPEPCLRQRGPARWANAPRPAIAGSCGARARHGRSPRPRARATVRPAGRRPLPEGAAAADDLGLHDARDAVRPQRRFLRAAAPCSRLDAATGTVRMLEKPRRLPDGPVAASHAEVALHLRAPAPRRARVDRRPTSRPSSFHRDYVDIEGTHHLSWTQEIGGRRCSTRGCQAAVTDRRPAADASAARR